MAGLTPAAKIQWMFESESMNGKDCTCIPGIGATMASRLKKNNIHMAYELFGVWLKCHKDEEKFGAWLRDLISCTNRTVQTVHTAFADWSHTFL